MIAGLDISDRNKNIDWDLLMGEDVNFVYFRATEEINEVDMMVEQNIERAKQYNVPFGVYHWLDPELHVGQQADNFLNVVDDFKGMLPPMVCLRVEAESVENISKNTHAFMRLLKQRTSSTPILYTSKEAWKFMKADNSWACDFPLWIDQPGTNWPLQLWPWAGWTFWQHAFDMKFPGITGEVGINWFNGNHNEIFEMVIH
jgi:lysozyme